MNHSFRFNEKKYLKKCLIGFLIDFLFCRLAETTVSGSPSVTRLFPKVTSVWGVGAVAILNSSVNYVCMWSTKKLTMPAYCVAANCNNSQTTPGITMHELPRNQPTVRQKWIKFIQFKRADFFAAPHHAHLYREHFSECDFANPMEYRYSFKILPDRLKLIRLYPCGSLGQSISFIFGARVDMVGIWSCDLGVMATLSVQQKIPFFVHLQPSDHSFTYIIVLREL